MRKDLLKIAVMGPESTGKSNISQALATHYQTSWVPEFARKYCAALGHEPTLEDERSMFIGQIKLEDEIAATANNLLICDTMFLTVKIWSEHVFNTYPPELDLELKNRHYDFFLIMNIDLPWEEDPLRNYPDLREHFLKIHVREILALEVPFAVISGLGKEREKNAISEIDSFLKKQ